MSCGQDGGMVGQGGQGQDEGDDWTRRAEAIIGCCFCRGHTRCLYIRLCV